MPKRSKPSTQPSGPGSLELVWVPAGQLVENPSNWRRHGPRQLASLRASLATAGWVTPLIYNKTTQRLIDGHARKSLCKPEELCPVVIGSWTPEQERKILLTLDPLSAQAEADATLLQELSEQVQRDLESATSEAEKENAATLATLATELSAFGEIAANGADPAFFPDPSLYAADPKERPAPAPQLQGPFRLATREETDTSKWQRGPMDIPCIQREWCGEVPADLETYLGGEPPAGHGLWIWGSVGVNTLSARMVPAFWTSDDRTQDTWNRPEHHTAVLLNSGVTTLVTPDFSCWEGAPFIENAWALNKQRWLGAYLATAGLRLIVNVSLGGLDVAPFRELVLDTLPKGLPSIGVQLCTSGKTDLGMYHRRQSQRLQTVVKTLSPESLLLYASEETAAYMVGRLPQSLRTVVCAPFMLLRGRLQKAKARQSRS